jgi:anti-anti-sigma factor
MSFTLEHTTIDSTPSYLIATATGRLDSVTSTTFEQALLPLFQQTGQHILLDCKALDYVASSGLRVVLMAAKRAQASQGRLLITGLQPQVRDVFAISGFLKILHVYDDLETGQAAMGQMLSANAK